MRVQLRVLLTFAGLAMCQGCATAPYFADRGGDALDIVTLTLGTGAGAKARVGPVQVALLENSDIIGIRSGSAFFSALDWPYNEEKYVLPLPMRAPTGFGKNWIFGMEGLSPGSDSIMAERFKEVQGYSPVYMPLLVFSRYPSQYTQLEVAGGLLFTVRVGVNPGELLDFIFGWGMLDIYGDDVYMRRARGEDTSVEYMWKSFERPAPVIDYRRRDRNRRGNLLRHF